METIVEYKYIYKLPNVKWKSFYLNADTDMEALKEAGRIANEHKPENYMVKKETTKVERLV
ncbi:hypothetical protein TROLL_114 [Bacillus phage Troll]|uniref:Uncharacterized protein n=8 Tax=Caudoviricetes TaxID=2731619 RepID=A0A7U3T8P7_9CAUD|nr:hypothetical protein TROLL_114 [Bacillus phage Troll]YP_009055872.1 hypothetical protein LD11_gp107 [Bacillus phage Riley]YP_009206466.1 hypothetical protein AVV02_gp111 [Bacillus phage AvesoBmore]AGM61407.1 hypothetical protein BTP1_41 [Bacillus phage phiBTP1]AMW61723.1 hypothetical protein JUGLONE_109 [Bacillus phage Juglone]ASZ75841.1 hypothetical protein TAFFO16_108 [Bacillus phage Taffo16]QDH49803.1 hypothetical protein BEYONPHE_116 [Bacillus phage Beyonphe]QPY77345.1 hypothetical pr